eukprot:12425911-Karenia_brevis.AAC.1
MEGQSSLLGLPGWTNLTAWMTWMHNLHCLDYLDGQLSPLGLPGWTSFMSWITWTDELHYLDGRPSLVGSSESGHGT